jgi:hypothetical protein
MADQSNRTAEASPEQQRAEEAFIRGLVQRGEAAKADEHGNLPPGATHEIVGESPSGLPIVVRRRFYGIKPTKLQSR